MSELIPVTVCPLCGRQCRELVSREQLSLQAQYRDRVLRTELPPGSPAYMLKDLTSFTNAYEARLVACIECGLVCRDPHFSPDASIAAYAQDEYEPEWLENTFREYYETFARRMPELKASVGARATVLEVGSYVGGFLAAAQDAGLRACGVDVGKRVSEFSRGKGLDVRTGTLAESRFDDNSFDAIVVWVCFDQLPDPRKELKEMQRVLRQGGRLYIQVPNGEFIKATEQARKLLPIGFWRENLENALAFTGIAGFPYQFGYTPKSLNRIIRGAGFQEIKIENRLDLCSYRGPATASRSRARSLKRVQQVTQAVHAVTAGRMEIGPWIEAQCRKI